MSGHAGQGGERAGPAGLPRKLFRLAVSSAGAALSLGLVLRFADPPSAPFFLASLGGSTVFLFGLTRTPAAQPRALFGGHLGGIFIGMLCYGLFGDAVWVYVLALVLTMVFMLATRTVHPPAGANPLIVMHTPAAAAAVWAPVLMGVGLLALCAMLWSRLFPGMVHYPCRWLAPSPPSMGWGAWDE